MHNKIGLKCEWPISKSGCKKTIPDQDQDELMYCSDQSRFPTLLSLLIYDASKKIILPV